MDQYLANVGLKFSKSQENRIIELLSHQIYPFLNFTGETSDIQTLKADKLKNPPEFMYKASIEDLNTKVWKVVSPL